MKIRALWGTRPFWITKLGQLSKVVWDSHAQPMEGEPQVAVEVEPGELGVTFIGHSSFLLQIAGKNVLVDPVFAKRLVVLRRQRRPGLKMRRLPGVDVVFLTHAHMDHLNRPSLRRIARQTLRRTGKAPIAVVPKGVEDLVETLGFREVRTMEWWQTIEVEGLTVTMTPCQHWGARVFHDTHRGYGGYVIEAEGQSIYHSGDTAYFPGFKEIGERLHPQIALLPIGAYFPDAYRAVHTNPEEALQGFVDLGAETMIPMHYGTFKLGKEPMDEPLQRLLADAQFRGLEDRVRVVAEGETLAIQSDVLTATASNAV
ncbi:L-ascorbate metabolism protein UlaG, beta-lactamase superfamily [Granulicella rosea]|uniref:L-ascorbate metabolism protein UlaG, beta-lactamase superfamily n=1 Tax=Granulicella rosea TaxID=474952 RepID=A0A239LCF9_9BACT|nr:MBL fold metallo-hydrolase [Granulicella rosea]SNT27533.1 L-ascorbate metabolism protein UlaG, beta-lactamase superfamily [Granulicella rosea]